MKVIKGEMQFLKEKKQISFVSFPLFNWGGSNTKPLTTPSIYHDKAGYLWSHAWIPAGIVAAPEFQMSGGHQWIQNMVLVVYIKGVTEVLRLAGGRKH